MSVANDLIELAMERLAQRPGYVDRPDQTQLALLLSDCIGSGRTGCFEAPTGLGKSLATLVPAIAHSIAHQKRIAIGTYTNVLAEQYWRKDLPLALSLFEVEGTTLDVKTEFLIGRQRYACQASMAEHQAGTTREFRRNARLGIESEFRSWVPKRGREMMELWQAVSAPPVCPARLCPYYHDCYYYKARRSAEKANIVITNHSLILQDALIREASQGELTMLGKLDFIIFDEAHDLHSAAQNALEFELSQAKMGQVIGVSQKLQATLSPLSMDAGDPTGWNQLCDIFAERAHHMSERLPTIVVGSGEIFRATPEELEQSPQIKARKPHSTTGAQNLSSEIADLTNTFAKEVVRSLDSWQTSGVNSDDARDTVRNYMMFLTEFGAGCKGLFTGEADAEVGVTYTAGGFAGREAILRHDVVDIAGALKPILWDKTPWACLSATLAVDRNFEFFQRTTGAKADFEDVLPSPFDWSTQASLYVPANGKLIDPSQAREPHMQPVYYDCLAKELQEIIQACGGRTLVLFHSRKEMEAVHRLMPEDDDLPIYVQRISGAASIGEKFKVEISSSMFALRSFWTGFDAPGETLSCVAIVRIPFEVPVDPPSVARNAWMSSQGQDPFSGYSLQNAKMLMRQGAGRLIRTNEDRGIIALLDPRLRTKAYGEQILENMPEGMRVFDDIYEAAARIGL
ncbi:MAG: ATP-dependent DNA helicase [Fimbriimonadaceae bacterium]